MVYLQEDDDLAKWRRYWCVLKNLKLDFWSSSDDVEVTEPLVTIPVTKVIEHFYFLRKEKKNQNIFVISRKGWISC